MEGNGVGCETGPFPSTCATVQFSFVNRAIIHLDGVILEMKKTVCAAAAAVLLMTTMRASAHHAFAAEYDENRHVTVSGTVTSFKWINPHAWLYVDRQDQNGKITKWSFEMGSPGGLTARGWQKTELKAGDRVTVEGFGAKDGRNVANAATVTLPGGRKLFGGFQTTPGAPNK
jgi:hypothetical protein